MVSYFKKKPQTNTLHVNLREFVFICGDLFIPLQLLCRAGAARSPVFQ